MHIEMHMDTVQCPMLICDIIDQNIAVTALLLQMYLSLISESSLNRVSDFNFWNESCFRECDGCRRAATLPSAGQSDWSPSCRTAHQTDCEPRLVFNYGLEIYSSVSQVRPRLDNSLLTVKFTRVSLRLPTCLPRICEFGFDFMQFLSDPGVPGPIYGSSCQKLTHLLQT